MAVDSYRWLPRSLAAYYREMDLARREPIPWTAPSKPLAKSTVAALTTGGLHLKGDRPFDAERERREPAWGDPTYRVIPGDVRSGDVSVSHLHYDAADVLEDINVLLPVPLLRKMRAEGRIGEIAPRHYSFMGFQLEPAELLDEHLPEVIAALKSDAVDLVVLTPA